MLAAMDTLKDALSSKQTPGEEAAVIDTPNLKIAVKADSPEDLAEASAPGSNFGGLKGTLADNTTDPVSTQVNLLLASSTSIILVFYSISDCFLLSKKGIFLS